MLRSNLDVCRSEARCGGSVNVLLQILLKELEDQKQLAILTDNIQEPEHEVMKSALCQPAMSAKPSTYFTTFV